MSKEADIEAKLWKRLKADQTVMLGLVGQEDGHAQPMTALVDEDLGDSSPIWFFTTRDNGLVQAMGRGPSRAVFHFAAKGHDLFACAHGELRRDDDALIINRLWNPSVAAWFKGKEDPNLQLLRFSPEKAEIWLNENSLFAGVKMLLGADPKKDYRDKVAKVALG